MRIAELYSHLNGEEFLLVRRPDLWREFGEVISAVNAEKCKTKLSREKTKKGQTLYSPVALNGDFRDLLREGDGTRAT